MNYWTFVWIERLQLGIGTGIVMLILVNWKQHWSGNVRDTSSYIYVQAAMYIIQLDFASCFYLSKLEHLPGIRPQHGDMYSGKSMLDGFIEDRTSMLGRPLQYQTTNSYRNARFICADNFAGRAGYI
jgi:hypothetical protein